MLEHPCRCLNEPRPNFYLGGPTIASKLKFIRIVSQRKRGVNVQRNCRFMMKDGSLEVFSKIHAKIMQSQELIWDAMISVG